MLAACLVLASIQIVNSQFRDLIIQAEPGSSHSQVVLEPTNPEPVPVVAGASYTSIRLRLTSPAPPPVAGPPWFGLLALTDGATTQLQATAGSCGDLAIGDTGPGLDGTDAVTGILSAAQDEVEWDLTDGLYNFLSLTHRRRGTFRLGGIYKICYADGLAWQAGGYIVPAEISSLAVYGALGYSEVDVMRNKRHRCFAGGVPGTNCKVQLSGAIGNTTGGSAWGEVHRLTWAQPISWEDTCGFEDAVPTIGLGAQDVPFLKGGAGGLIFDLGYTYTRNDARNYWLCYCPGFDYDNGGSPCSAKEDFVQSVGLLIIFNVKQSAAVVVPVTRFNITVQCGRATGCAASTDNRVRIVNQGSWRPEDNLNNLPQWDPSCGCRSAPQSASYLLPANCVTPTTCSAALNGGDFEDEKYFHELKMDNLIVHELSATRTFDVCYCDGACQTASNWLKVGTITVSRAVTADGPVPAQESNYPALETVNVPGVLRLGSIPNEYPDDRGGVTNSLRSGAQLKLLRDDGKEVTDADCGAQTPPSYIQGHGCILPSQCFPFSWHNDSAQTVAFNARWSLGGFFGALSSDDFLVQDLEASITVAQSGLYAVCYCQDGCDVPSNWARLTLLPISGPTLRQTWQYQTLIPFNLVIRGTGMRTDNRVRILASDAACNNDFETSWSELKARDVHHPFFNTTALSHDSPVWSLLGSGGPNYIVSASDRFGQSTEISFHFDARGLPAQPLLKVGDVLVLENVTVDLSGQVPFTSPASEDQIAAMQLPWGLTLAGRPAEDTSGTRWTVPPAFQDASGSATTWSNSMNALWRRTSEAAVEQMSSSIARTGLRVCWSAAGTENADFVAEAGVLDIEEAPYLAYSTASLVVAAADVPTPMVVAFQTSLGSSVRYQTAENSMMLRFNLLDSRMSWRMADTNASVLFDDLDRNVLGEEDQVGCGMLFLELWSDHPRGFPVPKGCFFQHSEGEYTIVFHPREGLASNYQYQVVLNVEIGQVAAGFWEEQPAVRVTCFDDVILRSEFAVEVGLAYLRSDRIPTSLGQGNTLGSFEIAMPREAQFVDLSAEPMVSFRITGGTGPVFGSQQLRFTFFPVTAWDLWRGCDASCGFPSDSDLFCSAVRVRCSAISVCSHNGAQRNVAQIVLPPETDAVTTTPLSFNLTNLALPPGGCFPHRGMLEVENTLSATVGWAWSSGTIYVPPELGFAGVVNGEAGDGNQRPFRADLLNSLYVRLQLGATVKSSNLPLGNASANLSSLRLTLPGGYTCVEIGDVPDGLVSVGTVVPLSKGGLPTSTQVSNVGAWSFDDNLCELRLAPWVAIHAGSAFFLRIVVNNPVGTLPMADPANVWLLTMQSFGDLATRLSSPIRPFTGGERYFSANVAVQGKLSVNLAPDVFTPFALDILLQVFFVTEQDAGERSQLHLRGPDEDPFDFGKQCRPEPLDELYYVDLSPLTSTFSLPYLTREASCRGLQSTTQPSRYYGAALRLSGRLRAGRRYAVGFRAAAPGASEALDFPFWSLQTLTALQEEIDGTTATVKLNPRQVNEESFRLFQYQPALASPTAPVLHFSSRLPTSVNTAVFISIAGFTLPSLSSCVLRVIAPALIRWSYDSTQFLHAADAITPYLPNNGLYPDGTPIVEEDLPTGPIPSPVVEPFNELVSTAEGNFQANVRYGLSARAILPNLPTTGSPDAFFLFCGSGQPRLSNRPLAFRQTAPTLAALVDASVGAARLPRGTSKW